MIRFRFRGPVPEPGTRIVAPFSGVIADRSGPRGPSVAGMTAVGLGLFAVSRVLAGAAPGIGLVLSLALVGLGAGLYVAPNSALIMGAAPRERQSTAGAATATARNLGMTLGIALAASHHSWGVHRALVVAAMLAGAGALLGAAR